MSGIKNILSSKCGIFQWKLKGAYYQIINVNEPRQYLILIFQGQSMLVLLQKKRSGKKQVKEGGKRNIFDPSLGCNLKFHLKLVFVDIV